MAVLSQKQQTSLRCAWHGVATIQQLARRFKISEETVRSFWKREKAAGRLPKCEPRPYFRRETAHIAPMTAMPGIDIETVREIEIGEAIDAAADRDLMSEIDVSERAAESADSFNVAASDRLLDDLMRCHGDLPVSEQIAPRSWLMFDLKGMEPPTPRELQMMARAFDQHLYPEQRIAREQVPA